MGYLKQLIQEGYSGLDLQLVKSLAYHRDLGIEGCKACILLLSDVCLNDSVFSFSCMDTFLFLFARHSMNIDMQNIMKEKISEILKYFLKLEKERLKIMFRKSCEDQEYLNILEEKELLACAFLSKIGSLGFLPVEDHLKQEVQNTVIKVQNLHDKYTRPAIVDDNVKKKDCSKPGWVEKASITKNSDTDIISFGITNLLKTKGFLVQTKSFSENSIFKRAKLLEKY